MEHPEAAAEPTTISTYTRRNVQGCGKDQGRRTGRCRKMTEPGEAQAVSQIHHLRNDLAVFWIHADLVGNWSTLGEVSSHGSRRSVTRRRPKLKAGALLAILVHNAAKLQEVGQPKLLREGCQVVTTAQVPVELLPEDATRRSRTSIGMMRRLRNVRHCRRERPHEDDRLCRGSVARGKVVRPSGRMTGVRTG